MATKTTNSSEKSSVYSLYSKPPPGEEIVISGIAGRFPESDNVRHFQENLLNKVDLITDDDRRWKLDHPEIPQRTGKINNVGKFDSLFFGVHFKQAHTMDPMCRMLLEHAYEAVVDAGVNPRLLRGSRTGVFMGACFSESEKTWFYEKLQVNGFGITGCSKAMLANRISYWLGVHGPSYNVDSACSSSLLAMENAYRAIRNGQCDAAIVGGSNLCLHPYVSLQFSRLGVLSADGCCKSFDADANGYARSEAIAVIFLQKAKDAKRVYCTFVHGKANCDGYKEQGITFPSSKIQSRLLQECYEECQVPPTSLAFLEAHGTGTKVGDPEEINAIEKVFCKDRTTPLRIGSVKSNLGHSEPASGLCSVIKVIIGMESGLLPPNLHYKRPREGVKALEDGRIVVVTDPTPWEGGYVGINSFGFGGANCHLLLKSNPKQKINNGAPKDDLPRLVGVSGRTEEAVTTLLDDICSRPVDAEYIRLLQDIHSYDIPGHLYRGYAMVGSETQLREMQNYSGEKRPIWFVFSGMGSQWAGMGQALMRFPVFAKAIQKCDAVLKPHGVDIIDIITNKDKTTFDNILNSFVGIAAVQIGLVDLLTSVGIVPDNIIGHSVGELGCAYADGCFTAEQMVLAAYSRGMASIETKIIHGSMAAVGLGYEDLKDMCPPDIEIACHNGPESSTISGPAESMKAFVAKLQANKIFAKEVPCSNIPYHSRYIAAAGPKLLAYLRKVIPEPKPRSVKWYSTSVPRSEWSTAAARLSSAEYHTNNLLSPVLFEETAVLIPDNAITIEIAPHGLLQAILRRSLNPRVTNIALTQRGHKDNVEVFLQALGKLYTIGLQPQLANLYPPVEYPVSRGTPMISPLVRWEHSDDWYVTSYKMQEKIVSGERTVTITLSDETYEFMAGHVIDGRNLFPATGYLSLIWETIGMLRGELYTEVPVVFEDVRFLRATTIPKEGTMEFTVMIHKGTGRFEVIEGGNAIVTGSIRYCQTPSLERIDPKLLPENNEEEAMTSRDVYKELRLRGYQYSGLFRGMKSASITGNKAHVAWENNWVAFMDNMLQVRILGMDTRGLFVPTGIRKLVLDIKDHLTQLRNMTSEEKLFPVYMYPEYGVLISGGIEIHGLKANAIARRKPAGDPVLEEYRFVAHRDQEDMPLREAIRMSVHLALENYQAIKVKTLEVIDDSDDVAADNLASSLILEILGDLPLIQANATVIANPERFPENSLPDAIAITELKKVPRDTNALIAIGSRLLSKSRSESLQQIVPLVRDGGFIISREINISQDDIAYAQSNDLDVVVEKRAAKELIVLLKKREKIPKKTAVVRVNNDEFSWLDEVQSIMKAEMEKEYSGNTKVLIVGEKDFENGVLGFVNCLRKEPGGEIVACVLIQDSNAPEFSLTDPFYSKQVQLDLAVNVLRGKVWGSYRHFPLLPVEPKPVKHIWANQLVRADLSSIRWLEGPLGNDKNEELLDVIYAPINFRDVMLATGKLAKEIMSTSTTRLRQECVMGFEYCGVTSAGRRVMGMINSRGFSNKIVLDELLAWNVPDAWTLEEAATVPCVYGTVFYALYKYANIQKGEKILIHAGTGGVGQAAITIALYEQCEVFTTVGTPEKRKFIREKFPMIDDDHIGNSRDTSFEHMIYRMTKGRGVDIVLNSLAEEKLQASVRCLTRKGRFLEIGKFDFAANNLLGMEIFLKEITFCGVMVDNVFQGDVEEKQALHKLLQSGLDNGSIKPISRTVFKRDQIETAFRYMAAGKHMGKVLIKIHDDHEKLTSPILAYPFYYCLPDKSYLILGGLGGFGLELADWLVLRGAKNLVLTSRTGIKNGYQRMRIELWKSYGVKVLIISGADASKREDCEFILKSTAKLGPVDGIFNLAVVLRDNLCTNQTQENFAESFKSKAWATKMLDELSRKICPHLQHFVVFSSVSCGRGNAGQCNYGMSNSVMERICEKRVQEGLPGLAIQWGAVGDVGLVADMQENNEELVIGGTLQQRISSCLDELNGFLRQKKPIVCSMVVAEKRAAGSGNINAVETVLNIMGLKDLKAVSPQTPLAELGMDSMMAVEIKQTLEREFEVFLTAQDIRNLNFAKLSEMAAQESDQNKKRRSKKDENEQITGLKMLVRTVGEEDLDTEIYLQLPSKNKEGKGDVYLIPGIEGCAPIFETLAPKLNATAVCLQFGLDKNNTHDSIPDMAKRLLPYVLERNKNRRDFVLVGYSYGSTITIELARYLEADGLHGRLVLIDGSPEQMKALKEQHVPAATNEELETNVLLGIMDILAPALSAELVLKLSNCKTWEEKLETFMSSVTSDNIRLAQDIRRLLCTGVYKRLLSVDKYASSNIAPIRSPIMLLKPTQPSARGLPEDYGLRKLTRDKVEIYYIEGNHVTMMEDNKVAAAINGEPLEDAEEFKASIMEDGRLVTPIAANQPRRS